MLKKQGISLVAALILIVFFALAIGGGAYFYQRFLRDRISEPTAPAPLHSD